SNLIDKVNFSKSGTYEVILSGKDLANNVTTKKIDVVIEDTTSPVISANTSITYERLASISAAQFLLDIAASLNEDGEITSDFTTKVKLNISGTYEVIITGEDLAANKSTKKVNVIIEDQVAPLITSADEITYERGLTKTNEAFISDLSATMNEEGSFKTNFKDVVNLNVSADYDVVIEAYDLALNKSEKIIKVHIVDTTNPIITSLDNIEYDRLETVTPQQFLIDINAVLNEPGIITSDFETIVDPTVQASYEVTLWASDSAGNQTSKSVMVIIKDKTAPKFMKDGELLDLGFNIVVSYERLKTISAQDFLDELKLSLNEAGTITTNFTSKVDLNKANNYQVVLTGTD
ncbi:MAG: LapB repeat-containing protein, partial [Bacilli bacterium]